MRNLDRFPLLAATLLALPAGSAWADGYICTVAEKAEGMVNAGNGRAAFDLIASGATGCVDDFRKVDAIRLRAARLTAADSEKKGKFDDAFGWYMTAKSVPDAGRMQRKLVEAKPQDTNTVGHAIEFFREQNDLAQEKAMRAVAAQNIERLLAKEQQQFAGFTRMSTTQYLSEASNWAHYAQTGQDRIKARSLLRGDTLAIETSARELQGAVNFYEQAGAAKTAQDENARQKQFKKEQEDLEKELGF